MAAPDGPAAVAGN